jgi:hypothetical protein
MSAQALAPPNSSHKVHCDLDDWDFDPRYTDGKCPICGWAPEGGAALVKPRWQAELEALPWDIIALGVLAVVLIVLGVWVGLAAGINIVPKS